MGLFENIKNAKEAAAKFAEFMALMEKAKQLDADEDGVRDLDQLKELALKAVEQAQALQGTLKEAEALVGKDFEALKAALDKKGLLGDLQLE